MVRRNSICRVLITGASGLLGYHAKAAILAENCSARFKNSDLKFEFVELPRLTEQTIGIWTEHAKSATLVLHLAGINRGSPDEVEHGNREIAELLVTALTESGSQAHVIYANSTHFNSDSAYGRGKKAADDVLNAWAQLRSRFYTNVILPHIFGENAQPNYNNVTATLCYQIVNNEKPDLHPGAHVNLLHAGAAIDSMLAAFESSQTGCMRLSGRHISVSDLYDTLLGFRAAYETNAYPDLSEPFIAALFNTYRSVEYPSAFPKVLKLHSDQRGTLFEAVKGGGGGQTFMSWTEPGVERGNHFHRRKVERFLVVSGDAEIRIRALFEERVDTYCVSGKEPSCVDMPTLHTHNIINVGKTRLLTLFWTHEIFDPEYPDTFAHPVILLKSDK
nr:NAD-dependent epimerase/dehydratase family protein [Granulosicoccus sp.]